MCQLAASRDVPASHIRHLLLKFHQLEPESFDIQDAK